MNVNMLCVVGSDSAHVETDKSELETQTKHFVEKLPKEIIKVLQTRDLQIHRPSKDNVPTNVCLLTAGGTS